jgi:hypothetical protein
MFFEGIYVDDRKIVRVEYNPVIADLTRIREVRLSDNWRGAWDKVRTFFLSHPLTRVYVPQLSFKFVSPIDLDLNC